MAVLIPGSQDAHAWPGWGVATVLKSAKPTPKTNPKNQPLDSSGAVYL
jgi:hypothetical protein